MKKALIVGSRGQDGHYLTENLCRKDYTVIGLDKDIAESTLKENFQPVDILDGGAVKDFLAKHKPDEIYYLAAFHQSSEDKNRDDNTIFTQSLAINVRGLFNFLEAIKRSSPATRLFYAASSHIFGNPKKPIQDETTPLAPNCIYGLTKTTGLYACRFYRNNYSVHASVGILYNHESPRRSPQFISQKIVQTMIAIKQKREKKLIVGNLEAEIDWGYAADYVEAMHRILQLPEADDFIVSSGTTHTIEDFIRGVSRILNLDYIGLVEENPGLITKKTKGHLQGDHTKLTEKTGWTPTADFEGLIKVMVDEGLKHNAEK